MVYENRSTTEKTPGPGALVALQNLKFRWSPRDPHVLDIADLRIEPGSRLFIQGPSGSGKTSLLNLLAGVVVPTKGSLSVLGKDLTRLSGPQRDAFRADHVGFVFQMFNLIPYLSLVENVLLPLRFSRRRLTSVRDRVGDPVKEARRLLEHLGLGSDGLQDRTVTRLSVGQQQRVAVARALIGQPELVICDEPTSALDAQARSTFMELLFKEVEKAGASLIYVSHDKALAGAFDQTFSLADINRAATEGEA